jgi:hypothetical protein
VAMSDGSCRGRYTFDSRPRHHGRYTFDSYSLTASSRTAWTRTASTRTGSTRTASIRTRISCMCSSPHTTGITCPQPQHSIHAPSAVPRLRDSLLRGCTFRVTGSSPPSPACGFRPRRSRCRPGHAKTEPVHRASRGGSAVHNHVTMAPLTRSDSDCGSGSASPRRS